MLKEAKMSITKVYNKDLKWGRSLGKLISNLSSHKKFNWKNAAISSVTDDSRQVGEGTLFVAVNGEMQDGHDFIPDAVRRGASAILCEKLPDRMPECPVIYVYNARQALSSVAAQFYGTADSNLKVVGTTGTDGKTTTTHLIHAILNASEHRAGLIGTLKNDLGMQSMEATQTTPHPVSLHFMLREMRRSKLSHAVMEVSSHSLVHQRVAHVPFDIGVLTNITEDHLDFHGTIEEYIRAKEILFRQLDQEAIAVLNADSPVWKRFARSTEANVLTYAINHVADVRLVECKQSVDGTRMVIRNPLETYEVNSPLVGLFNCENVLASATVAFASGIAGSTVKEAIGSFKGVPGRLEKITHSRCDAMPSFFVDYAHTPDALEKILNTLRPLTDGQLICVFGCGGDREKQKRPKMGNIATSIADVSVITADNSRSESTEDIIADITTGINKSGGRYITDPDRRIAIEKALNTATSEKDVIVVCGKGAEKFLHIGDSKIPFDDRDVCRQVIDSTTSKKRKTA